MTLATRIKPNETQTLTRMNADRLQPLQLTFQ